jgi:hypothetical protein
MKNASIITIVLIAISLSSCSKKLTYYSNRLQNEFNWSERELEKIQFYVSQDIRLVRSSNSGNTKIEDGKIKVNDDSRVNEVLIKRGTPGTLVFSPNERRFAVSFESDDDNFLMFGPSEKNNGRYTLLAKDWQRNNGIITYGGVEYRTGSESAYAALMVDIKKANNNKVSSKTAQGRKVR